MLLVQLAEAEGGAYDPTDDFPPESQPPGFVFSRPAIQRQIERSMRLRRALDLSYERGPRSQPPTCASKGEPRPIGKQPTATQGQTKAVERIPNSIGRPVACR